MINRKKVTSLNVLWKRKIRKLQAGPILDSEGMGAFFWAPFLEKRAFCLLAPPKQMSFLTISNKNIFFKTKGTRLGAIVARSKCLE